MADLSIKRVDQIGIGDSVITELLKPRKIRDIHSKKVERMFRMVFLNGVGLTTGHPVLINNKWERSSDVASPVEVADKSFMIYNFVLEGGPEVDDHSIILNGLVVCTLGKYCGDEFCQKYPKADKLYGSGFWKTT
ncbi:hypothetical protein Pelo_8379 [Pelomyxa schiedti]|nr:hypothetical protein Pelo_8379 [Pelomyxa schiedti]